MTPAKLKKQRKYCDIVSTTAFAVVVTIVANIVRAFAVVVTIVANIVNTTAFAVVIIVIVLVMIIITVKITFVILSERSRRKLSSTES